MDALLECRGLTKSYGRKTALSGVDLTISRGKIVGLLGPNGSGKTTLIKLACGLLTPTAGQILVEGKEPGVESRLAISYLPDKNYLNDWMKVSDLVDYFKDFYSNFDPRRAYDMLSKLNIDPDLRLKTLSKGTKEKVQLILVMSRDAQLYLLDEPIGGVDPAARDYILNTILKRCWMRSYLSQRGALCSLPLWMKFGRKTANRWTPCSGRYSNAEKIDEI